ncbi:hypothetical protein [Chamaesiphon sp. VAR_69_metabat_338]|uniref:hypothetical protein n=1 Tax=Chamaesiphon sp. VAR_69_metabat_338 TaxID=2964704 RepID=UPI00286EA926|nr:hypothetical protein [Chamaesiphon sp. VAR_69_metabat_338]
MTFTSVASKPVLATTDDRTILTTAKLSKVAVAGSLAAIAGVTILQNLLWMQVSSPAELPTHHKQAAVTTVK